MLLLGLVLVIILVACGTSPAAPPQAEAPSEVATATGVADAGEATATTTEEVAATDGVTATDAVTETQPEITATPADETEAVINEITAQVRHWQGEPDAPVTIIDFSDFL